MAYGAVAAAGGWGGVGEEGGGEGDCVCDGAAVAGAGEGGVWHGMYVNKPVRIVARQMNAR